MPEFDPKLTTNTFAFTSAFPHGVNYNDTTGDKIITADPGMSLRDYFAAKAMHALWASGESWELTGSPADDNTLADFAELAGDSYALADAMLKARSA